MRILKTIVMASLLSSPLLLAGDSHEQHRTKAVVVIDGQQMSVDSMDLKDGETKVVKQGDHTLKATRKGDKLEVTVDGKPLPLPPDMPLTAGAGAPEDGKKVVIINKEVQVTGDGEGGEPAQVTKEVKKVVFVSTDGETVPVDMQNGGQWTAIIEEVEKDTD